MKIFGSISELVSAIFRKNSQAVTFRPNQATTYTASRDIQLPPGDTDHVIMSATSTATMTNKTFDADGTGNSITNIENADIKAGAAIARSKIAAGSANHVIIDDGSGNLSSEATLAKSRGGTGADNSSVTFPASGTIPTTTSTDTQTNKTFTGPVITDYIELTEVATPSTPAASKIRVYAKSDNSVYQLDPNGVESPLGGGSGSGSGEVNMIANPSASSATTGWTAGTSHSIARDTSNSPLSPVISTSLAMTATTTASESSTSGDYYTISTVPAALKNRKLKLDIYFTSVASQTWAVSIYSGSTRMPLSTDSSGATLLPTAVTGKYTTYVDADASSSYTVHFTRTAGSGSTTLYVTALVFGPGIQPQGAVAGPLTAFTPASSQGLGTLTNINLFYARVGEYMLIQGRLTLGSVTASEARIQLPTGYTVGALGSSLAQPIGRWTSSDNTASSVKNGTVIAVQGNNYLNFSFDNYTSTVSSFTPSNGSTVFNGGFALGLQSIWIPIAEWAGSGTVNLAQNDVEYAYNTSGLTTAGATDDTAFGYGPGGAAIGSIASTTAASNTSMRCRFQTPIQITDSIELELSRDGVVWSPVGSDDIGQSIYQGTSIYGASIIRITSSVTDVYVGFGNQGIRPSNASYAGSGLAWSNISTARWRVKKAKAGAAVGFGKANDGSNLGSLGLVPAYSTSFASTFTFDGTGSPGTSASKTIYVTRVEDRVTISIYSGVNATTGTSSTKLTSNTALPTWARPVTASADALYGPVTNGGNVTVAGYVTVSTAGLINLFRDAAGTAYSNSVTGGHNGNSLHITYLVR